MRSGELEAISLALEVDGDLLMDECPGRARAAQEGLRVFGTVDVLLLAKTLGHIDFVKPQLDALLAAGFRLKPDVCVLVLQKAGEL